MMALDARTACEFILNGGGSGQNPWYAKYICPTGSLRLIFA